MRRYRLSAIYLQLNDKDQNKGATMYIDGRTKDTWNIVGFINSTQRGYTIKKVTCIFEGCEGNHVFVCSIKLIVAWKGLLINYNLNRIDTNMVTMGVVDLTIYPTFN